MYRRRLRIQEDEAFDVRGVSMKGSRGGGWSRRRVVSKEDGLEGGWSRRRVVSKEGGLEGGYVWLLLADVDHHLELDYLQREDGDTNEEMQR
jgi:hypothetical protein